MIVAVAIEIPSIANNPPPPQKKKKKKIGIQRYSNLWPLR